MSPPVRCSIEDCVRGDGKFWGVGPDLCIPHRAEWAADHEPEIPAQERDYWWKAHEYEYGKEHLSAWPGNFKTPVRPAKAVLDAMQARDTELRLKEQADKKRLREMDEARRPGFGQDRWGSRR